MIWKLTTALLLGVLLGQIGWEAYWHRRWQDGQIDGMRRDIATIVTYLQQQKH